MDNEQKELIEIPIGRMTFDLLVRKGITRYRKKGFVFNALAISDDIQTVGIAIVGRRRALVIPKYLIEILKYNSDVTTADKHHRFRLQIIDAQQVMA